MFDDPMFNGYGRPMQLPRVSSLEEFNQQRIPPNSTVAGFHNAEDIFFIKSSDSTGQCSPTRAFRFEEIDIAELTPVSMSKKEFDEMKEMFRYVQQFIQAQQPAAQEG